MATRTDLLKTLNTYDTAKLQKLVDVADKILLPDYESLVQVTFNDMITKAHSLADIHFPQWTDRTAADFGEFLVELFAMFSWKDFFYINIFNMESNLLTAKSYKNVYLLAKMLGYQPRLSKSSSVSFNVTFNNVPVGGTVLKKGDLEITIANTDLVFTNSADVTIAAGTSTVTIAMLSGRFRTQVGTYIGRSFRIPGNGVSADQLTTIQIGNDTWTLVTDFSASNSTSPHFMILPTDNDELEIVFGSGDFGKRPDLNALITINILFDNSTVADRNILNTTQLNLTKDITNTVTSVSMIGNAINGASAENIEVIRNNASVLYRTRNTAIKSSDDCIAVLESYPDIRKATAFNIFNTIYFAVIKEDGTVADTTFMNTLKARIADMTLNNFLLSGSLTSFITITEMTLDCYLYNEFDSAAATTNILDHLVYMTDPMGGAKYGDVFDMGQVSSDLVQVVGGLTNVVVKTVNGVTAANIVLSPLQILNKINPVVVTVNIIRVS